MDMKKNRSKYLEAIAFAEKKREEENSTSTIGVPKEYWNRESFKYVNRYQRSFGIYEELMSHIKCSLVK